VIGGIILYIREENSATCALLPHATNNVACPKLRALAGSPSEQAKENRDPSFRGPNSQPARVVSQRYRIKPPHPRSFEIALELRTSLLARGVNLGAMLPTCNLPESMTQRRMSLSGAMSGALASTCVTPVRAEFVLPAVLEGHRRALVGNHGLRRIEQ